MKNKDRSFLFQSPSPVFYKNIPAVQTRNTIKESAFSDNAKAKSSPPSGKVKSPGSHLSPAETSILMNRLNNVVSLPG